MSIAQKLSPNRAVRDFRLGRRDFLTALTAIAGLSTLGAVDSQRARAERHGAVRDDRDGPEDRAQA